MSAPGLEPSHEDRLLEEARAGDAGAFWRLAQEYRPYLRAVAARVLGGRLPSDATDVVDDGLDAALGHLPQFQGPHAGAFRAWLVTIVRNRALQALRQAARHRPLAGGAGCPEPLVGDSSGPDVKAARREEAARLLAAIERLPDDQRRALELRHFQGLPFEEVARHLGRSPGAVRQLWVRAVRRLGGELGGAR